MCFAKPAGWQLAQLDSGMLGVWLAVDGGTP